MAIYLGLIGFWVLSSLLVKSSGVSRERGERLLLALGMTALFLLLVLKKDTVGADTLGYRQQYRIAATVAWKDFDYVYFEKGYIFLMKLFSKSGLSFRWFTGFIYGVLCLGYWRFLRKHSENVTLSLLILFCYQFLVFHISGLRQSLAMGICLFAFLALERGKELRFLLLTLLAGACHRGAYAFLLVWPVYRLSAKPLPVWLYGVAPFLAAALRPVLWLGASLVFPDLSRPGGIALGGNLLFLAGMAAFLLYTRLTSGEGELFFAHMALAALCADLVLSGSTLLRCNLFYTLFLLPGIPNTIARYEHRTRLVLSAALGLFLVILFYGDTLSINQLGLLPYRFFWDSFCVGS